MNKFISCITGLILLVSSVANASIVINGKEYLDLNLTNNKTVAEVQSMIAGDNQYDGYQIATDVEVAELYSLLPHASEGGNVYHSLGGYTLSDVQINIWEWLWAAGDINTHGKYTGTGVHNLYFAYYTDTSGILSYVDSNTGAFESGNFQLLGGSTELPSAIRTTSPLYDLTNVNTSYADRSNASSSTDFWAVVRPVVTIESTGLIIGDKEYLNLGLTNNKTVAQVQVMINGDSKYAGYRIATDVVAAELFSRLPHLLESIAGFHTLASPLTDEEHEIIDWISTGYTQNHALYSGFGVHGALFSYDTEIAGQLNYIDSATSSFESGSFQFFWGEGVPTAIRSFDSIYEITNTDTTFGDMSNRATSTDYSLFVRPVEPASCPIY